MERWTFGVEPLPQTVETAGLLRRLTAMLLSMEGDDELVAELQWEMQQYEDLLLDRLPKYGTPRVGDAASGEGRIYLDHSRDIGAYNPCFPLYDITVEGDRAAGTTAFGVPFEGPPGIVHGGFLAVFFDCVMQHHNCDVGVAGKTTSLALRYRRPVPLLAELHFELTRTVTDGRIHSTGTLRRGDDLLCEAEMEAVAGNRDALPEVSPRRPHP